MTVARPFGMHVRLVELRARPLDVLLHEQQLLHARQLFRVCGQREHAAEILDRQTRLAPVLRRAVALCATMSYRAQRVI